MSEIKNEELKPCPFCGETAYLHYHNEDVICGNCDFSIENTKWNTRAEPDFKLKAMQGLLDGQAVVIKELEDKLEQVKFALEVESHDNEYNCAEKDKYKAIAEELADALKFITESECWVPIGGGRLVKSGFGVAKKALAKFEEMRG